MAEQHEEHEEQDENAPRECCGSTACPPGYEDNSPCKARWNWCIAISAGPIWIMWVVWIITNPGQAVIFLVHWNCTGGARSRVVKVSECADVAAPGCTADASSTNCVTPNGAAVDLEADALQFNASAVAPASHG